MKKGFKSWKERGLLTIATEWFLRHQFPAELLVLELWHQRFRHANFKQVAKISKFEAVEGLPKFGKVEKTFCGACQMGKQTKASHHKVNVIATSRCLELLHVDLMGPTRTESLGGKRYIMVIVDNLSRYT